MWAAKQRHEGQAQRLARLGQTRPGQAVDVHLPLQAVQDSEVVGRVRASIEPDPGQPVAAVDATRLPALRRLPR